MRRSEGRLFSLDIREGKTLEATMKLSEAMREGAKLRPQFFGWYYGRRNPNDVLGTCAVASVWEGLGHTYEEYSGGSYVLNVLQAETGLNLETTYVEYEGQRSLYGAISYQNDQLHKSREEIADWLESEGY